MKSLADWDASAAPVFARMANAREHFARALESKDVIERSDRLTAAQVSLFDAQRDLQELEDRLVRISPLNPPNLEEIAARR